MAKYYIKTFGCQANKAESQRQQTYFESRGLRLAPNWQQASEIFINTCSVRKAADDRVYALLNQMQDYYNSIPRAQWPHVVISGCMNRYADRLKKRFPVVSEVLTSDDTNFQYPATRPADDPQAFIQISVGCNSYCTYCVVPYARGPERSRDFDTIIGEVEQAVREGHHEITLLGQNVNSWGLEKVQTARRKQIFGSLSQLPANADQYQTFTGTSPFVQLLRAVSHIDGVDKIRFLTSNPWDFHDDLIAEVISNKKIDRYLHLPVQSGSDTVLSRMNRGYTAATYERLVTKLRAGDPSIQIGTDIIVGFCGETEAEFAQTLAFVKKMHFIVAFVAMYSPRPGTVSAKIYRDDVPFAVKKRRFEILDKIINRDQLASRPKIV